MKKLLGLAALAMISILSSCSSDSDGDGGGSANGQITATVDGQSWASMPGGAVASVMQQSLFEGGGLTLQIIGMTTDQSSLSIQIPVSNISPGTYTFSGEDSEGLVTYSPSDFESYSSLQGGSFTLTITSLDLNTGKLSGTFSATLYDFDGVESVEITNGEIDNILLIGQTFYSNGSMTLTRNNTFTMDAQDEDGKYLVIHEDTFTDSISLFGYNLSLTNDAGAYSLNFPKDITPGTYDLETGTDYSAGYSGVNDDETEFNLNSGTLTITSHNGNTIVGTFSYSGTFGATNVNVTGGSFSITHN